MRASQQPRRARRLRAQQTDAERKLWFELRDRRLDGYKVRRQVPIGPFIADFACIDCRLVIEIDGGQDSGLREADERRTRWLKRNGWHVLRFWNNDVMNDIEAVLQTILAVLRTRPHPDPLPQAGEGED